MATFLDKVLDQFDPISLADMKDYRLMNRVDTKYICHVEKLPEILESATSYFNIQTCDSVRKFSYESLYFDTPYMKTYFDHHQGRRLRYKIRFRKYINSDDVFLEIKLKKNFSRTDKRRVPLRFSSQMETEHIKFLNQHIAIPNDGFVPSIWTLFDRLTLAGKNHLERITIDSNIRFKNNKTEVGMCNLAIIEVKRSKIEGISPFATILKDKYIRPFGISKYVLGNILLNPNIKHNRFNNRINTINKICYGT